MPVKAMKAPLRAKRSKAEMQQEFAEIQEQVADVVSRIRNDREEPTEARTGNPRGTRAGSRQPEVDSDDPE